MESIHDNHPSTSLYISSFSCIPFQHHKHSNTSTSMASFKLLYTTFTLLALLSSSTFCSGFPSFHFGWGNGGGGGGGGGVTRPIGSRKYSGLFPGFYSHTCPQANDIVMSVLEKAISKEPRMAASLLRLHFHDCFVQVIFKSITFMIINCGVL